MVYGIKGKVHLNVDEISDLNNRNQNQKSIQKKSGKKYDVHH